MRHLPLAPFAFAVLALVADRASAIGLLVPTDPGMAPLSLVHHRVEATVVERGAVTKVTQEFDNPTDRVLEATYLFPLPAGATVDTFALWMNGKREVGKVMEKGEARRIYEGIVRQARDPGLIEYIDGTMFQARVFPIPPRGRQKVELTFSHLVDYEGGVHRYVYPMKTDQRATTTLQDFTFTLKIEGKLPLQNLVAPTHAMAIKRDGKRGIVSMEKNGFSLDEDLNVFWQVNDDDVGLTVLTHKEEGEAGYFMLLASPKDKVRDQEIVGKRVAFVVDTSGSMAGEKMEATQKALQQQIEALGEDDLFSIVRFGGYAEAYAPKMVAASAQNKQKAKAFVQQLEPEGGTNIDEALELAFSTTSGSSKTPLMVVFMTDGRPTVGNTDAAFLVDRTRKAAAQNNARVFVLGVGEDLNAVLLDQLAGDGGSALYLKGTAALEGQVAAFWERVSYPVLSDVKLEVDGVAAFGMLPRRPQDLFRGQQLVVLGRYREPGSTQVKLTGTMKSGARSFVYRAQFDDTSKDGRHAFIARLWAQRQVGMLLDEIRAKGETPGLVAEVTQLATRFGIVTPYTSYLVVEPQFEQVRVGNTMPPPPPPRPMPLPVESAAEDDSSGFGFFGPRGSGSAPRAPSAEPATKMDLERVAKKARDELRTAEGKGAVDAAKDIARLKEKATTSGRALTTERFVSGRVFKFIDGFFVDGGASAKDTVLTVKPYSAAWFEVLRLRPDLKSVLALGERVKVRVAPGRSLVVDQAGADTLDAKTLRAFLAK